MQREGDVENKATLTLDGVKYELPIVVGSENEFAIDISELRSKTGLITLDPGYVNTGSCTSAITWRESHHALPGNHSRRVCGTPQRR